MLFSFSSFATTKVKTTNAEPNKVYQSSEVIIISKSAFACKGGTCTITGPDGHGGTLTVKVCCEQIVILAPQ